MPRSLFSTGDIPADKVFSPADRASEASVLSCLMLAGMEGDGDAIFKAIDILGEPTAFFDEIHREVYRAILRLVDRGGGIDAALVVTELDLSGHEPESDPHSVVTQILASQAVYLNLRYHAQNVRKAADRRRDIEDAHCILRAVVNRDNQGAEAALDRIKSRDHSSAHEAATNRGPVPIGELRGGDRRSFRWDGFIADDGITMIVGPPKVGKSTLIGHLLAAFGSGGKIAGRAVHPSRVLVISEESESHLSRRRDELQIGNHVDVWSRPFAGKPSPADWIAFLRHVSSLVRSNGYRVVVFDTLASVAPFKDENSSAEVMASLAPIIGISNAGAATLIIHHSRKTAGGEGTAVRGSSAILGFVDTNIEIRRFDASRRQDRRRVLTAFSRDRDTPPEVVIELNESGLLYDTIGTSSNASQEERLEIIARVLNDSRGPLTVDDVRNGWPSDSGIPKPGRKSVSRDMSAGYAHGRWTRIGGGKRNDPYRYHSTP
ncbi:MAG: AAA family ATPase [Phycisphaerales bacterium]